MTKYMQKDSIVLISKSDIQELLPDVSVATIEAVLISY